MRHAVQVTERGDWAEPDSDASQHWPDSVPHVFFLDPAEGRPVNPNTPEGEIRNIAAFAAGVHAVPPLRRLVVKCFVWLVLLGITLGTITGIVHGLHSF